MFGLFGKAQASPPGARAPPALPVRILTAYARTHEELQLFGDDLAACSPAQHLAWDEALEAFPEGVIPAASFEHRGRRWQLSARAGADGRRVLHIATPAPLEISGTSHELVPATPQPQQPQQRRGGQHRNGMAPARAGDAAAAGNNASGPLVQTPSDGSPTGAALRDSGGWSGSGGSDAGSDGGRGAARRKYVRDIVIATNPAHDSLGRYKSLIALIEHCKARAAALRPGAAADWGREPAASLLHTIVDVGEALAGFGNAAFPERSGEARAVLAADYKALLSEYLRHLGGVLVPGACRGLSADAEAELRSVGSLLATRCEAYKVLYEQLVQSVGTEGRPGGRGAAAAPCLIFNTNSNSVAASPVTTNHNSAEAASKAKAINQGIGAAALAAAALAAVVLFRALRGRGGSSHQSPLSREDRGTGRPASFRVPSGKGGRELALVSVLSACGDELRKAAKNESVLQDDWRLGRVRLAWPPAPAPPGYEPVSSSVCDVTGALQELYGR